MIGRQRRGVPVLTLTVGDCCRHRVEALDDSNVLEVLIGRLRRKLDPDGGLRPIETLRGRGYRLALPRSDEG